MSHTGHADDINDETPLLRVNDVPRKPTALPTSQILIICSERLCLVIAFSSINPYIPQVREMFLTRYVMHLGNIAIS